MLLVDPPLIKDGEDDNFELAGRLFLGEEFNKMLELERPFELFALLVAGETTADLEEIELFFLIVLSFRGL